MWYVYSREVKSGWNWNMQGLDCRMMTNRELWEAMQRADKRDEWPILEEMAKRVNRLKPLSWCPTKELIQEIRQVFSQYKLNGAGDQTW